MSKKNHYPWKSQNSAPRPAVNPAVAPAAAALQDPAGSAAALQNPARPAHEAAAAAGEPTLDSRNEMASSGRAVAAATSNDVRKQGDSPAFSAITPAQLLANKANALLSTGPRTTAGLAKSSLNAVKVGLTDAAEYAAFVEGFRVSYNPVGPAECELVQNIADAFWRGRRIRTLEFAIYAHGHAQFKDDFNDYPEEVRPHMIALQTDMVYEKQIRNYHRHEARLDRQRTKDTKELSRLQAERRANEGLSSPETAAPVANSGYDPDELQPGDAEFFAALDAHFMPWKFGPQAQQNAAVLENGFVLSNEENAENSIGSSEPEAA